MKKTSMLILLTGSVLATMTAFADPGARVDVRADAAGTVGVGVTSDSSQKGVGAVPAVPSAAASAGVSAESRTGESLRATPASPLQEQAAEATVEHRTSGLETTPTPADHAAADVKAESSVRTTARDKSKKERKNGAENSDS